MNTEYIVPDPISEMSKTMDPVKYSEFGKAFLAFPAKMKAMWLSAINGPLKSKQGLCNALEAWAVYTNELDFKFKHMSLEGHNLFVAVLAYNVEQIEDENGNKYLKGKTLHRAILSDLARHCHEIVLRIMYLMHVTGALDVVNKVIFRVTRLEDDHWRSEGRNKPVGSLTITTASFRRWIVPHLKEIVDGWVSRDTRLLCGP
jgi:hypothetical protein